MGIKKSFAIAMETVEILFIKVNANLTEMVLKISGGIIENEKPLKLF